MQQTQSVENIFARSWQLLTSNWVIIVPGLLIGIVLGLINAIILPTPSGDTTNPATYNVAGRLIGGMISAILGVIAYVATVSYTTGMAGAAWLRGKTTLADGTRAFERDWRNVVMAAIFMLLIFIVAAILAPFTLFLSIFAAALFLFYVMPSAVVGERSGSAAIAESFEIAKRRFMSTFIVIVVIFVISMIMTFIALALRFAPFIGPILQAAVQQAVIGFTTLVAVGEYLNLRSPETIAAATTTATTVTPTTPTSL